MMNRIIIIIILLFVLIYSTSSLNDIKNCRNALGMQSGHILDSQLSASSSYNEITLGPISSRIRTEKNGGAWCPKAQITTNVYEYLQIDLKSLHVLTMIETQGRFGNGQGVELTEIYRIEYTRDNKINSNNNNQTTWIRYKDRENNEQIKGNDNTYSTELRELNRPIIARSIRIIPISKLKRTVCLRVELYGCQFKDDILSYETSNGDLRNVINFKDKIYDGIQTSNGYLKDGLGLLTDGELGDDSFRYERYGLKGYDWVGWRNDSFETHHKQSDQLATEPHRILFTFDNFRNFSLCTLYINNVPNQKIELYKLIRFKFSLNGVDFINEFESTLNRDLNMNMARPILVPLKFNVAKYILIEIYFYSKWFIVSEISFDSEYVDLEVFENILTSSSSSSSSPDFAIEQQLLKQQQITNIYELLNNSTNNLKSSSVTVSSSVNNGIFFTNHLTLQTLIMILITLLVLLIVIFIFIIFCFIRKRQRLSKKFEQQYHIHKPIKQKNNCLNIGLFRRLFLKDNNNSSSPTSSVGVGVGGNINTFSTALTTSSTSSTNTTGLQTQNLITSLQKPNSNLLTTTLFSNQTQINNLDTMKSTNKFLASFENSLESTYLYPSLKYKAINTANENAEVLKALLNNNNNQQAFTTQQQKFLKLIESNNNNNNNNIHYAATDLSSPPSQVTTTTTASTTFNNNSKMIKLIPIQQYNTINTNQIPNTNLYYTIKPQSAFCSQTTSTISRLNTNKLLQIQQQQQQQPIEFVSMRKIDANLLCFLDKIGESTVSNFYIGKMNTKSLSMNEINKNNNNDDDNNNNNNDNNIDVLIKVLKTEHDPVIKFGFDNDIDLTVINKLKIDNLNLIQLLGFCDNPYCYIIENYSNNSNLYEFIINPTIQNNNNLIINNKKSLQNILLQITSAMLYLESLNNIHKDLSCKNCIINIDNNTNEISIKICDLARYMYNYRSDYCILLTNTQQSIRLRYTSWETICTGQFTNKSDVWSFGIIIFELLTLCKQVPYTELNDEQLIQLINTTYSQQQQQQQNLNYLIQNYLTKQSIIDDNKDLVDLMFECLNLNIFNRPTFNDLNIYLKYQYELQ